MIAAMVKSIMESTEKLCGGKVKLKVTTYIDLPLADFLVELRTQVVALERAKNAARGRPYSNEETKTNGGGEIILEGAFRKSATCTVLSENWNYY